MKVEEWVYSVLKNHAGVAALTTAARIKPLGLWEGLVRPYIVHFPTNLRGTLVHRSRAGLTHWDFYQVSCFADSYSGARALADQVRIALGESYGEYQARWIGEGPSILDTEVQPPIHHIPVNFNITGQL